MRIMSFGPYLTPAEIQTELGIRLRALRLDRSLSQAATASRAGVSLRAIQHLEAGTGSTLESFIRVLKALGYSGAFDTMAPAVGVKPLEMLKRRKPRLRAPKASTNQ